MQQPFLLFNFYKTYFMFMRILWILLGTTLFAGKATAQDSLKWLLRTNAAPAFNGTWDKWGIRMTYDAGYVISSRSSLLIRYGYFMTNGDRFQPYNFTTQFKLLGLRYNYRLLGKRNQFTFSVGPGLFFGRQFNPFRLSLYYECDNGCREFTAIYPYDEGLGWASEVFFGIGFGYQRNVSSRVAWGIELGSELGLSEHVLTGLSPYILIRF
mgnify:CR=1 FL=1